MRERGGDGDPPQHLWPERGGVVAEVVPRVLNEGLVHLGDPTEELLGEGGQVGAEILMDVEKHVDGNDAVLLVVALQGLEAHGEDAAGVRLEVVVGGQPMEELEDGVAETVLLPITMLGGNDREHLAKRGEEDFQEVAIFSSMHGFHLLLDVRRDLNFARHLCEMQDRGCWTNVPSGPAGRSAKEAGAQSGDMRENSRRRAAFPLARAHQRRLGSNLAGQEGHDANSPTAGLVSS